jgi:hypothetical protein
MLQRRQADLTVGEQRLRHHDSQERSDHDGHRDDVQHPAPVFE